MSTPEAVIKAKIRKYLVEEKKAYYFAPVQRGMGASTVDILTCIPKIITPEMVGRRIGLFGAIEAKVPGKVPTVRQSQVIRDINAAGGLAFWTDNVEHVQKVLEAHGL